MWARMSVLSDVKEGGTSAAVSSFVQLMRCLLFFGLGMMLCRIRIVYGARADVGWCWLSVVLRYRFYYCLRVKNDNAAIER